jgi:phospholipase C
MNLNLVFAVMHAYTSPKLNLSGSIREEEMAKKRVFVQMHNNSSATFCIRLYHWNADYGIQCHTWTLKGGQISKQDDTMLAHFTVENGSSQQPDYWWASLSPVKDASGANWYVSQGDTQTPTEWPQCQLQPANADQKVTFTVDESNFHINLSTPGVKAPWINLGGTMNVNEIYFTHIFVLMLENHSFDNIFAFSGISGIKAATADDSNSYSSRAGHNGIYYVRSPAPANMPTDPGHEFMDVVEQLCGQDAHYSAGAYPDVNNSGFVTNYATSTSEEPLVPLGTGLPESDEIGDIMACFNTADQLPVIYTLAKQFSVCDQWFSSMPGPTWPNRYFVHGASSAGLDDSPSTKQLFEWETGDDRFQYPNGSLYDRLKNLIADNSYKSYAYRLYQDQNGWFEGATPQVASIENIESSDVNDLDSGDSSSAENFVSDLSYPYPYRYTFIEPNYGETFLGTYIDGTSQHPMDGVSGGEGLIKKVYEAIRNSPLWETSLLIVTYDEHGGFYDSVPPPTCVAPGDGPYDLSTHDFDFTQYGVRVPTVVVSCRIGAGTVDDTVFDHASIPATVLAWLGAGHLTQRDKHANTLIGKETVSPRGTCPKTLPNPATTTPAPAPAAKQAEPPEQQPLPAKGNLIGFLAIAAKADFELSSRTPEERTRIAAKLQAIKTRGQAKDYMVSVKRRVDAARAAKKAGPPKARPQTV